MTTTTGPDLSIAQQALIRLMDDTCDITSGPRLPDGSLNTTTFQLGSGTAPTTDYSGPCKVRPGSAALLARTADEGRRTQRVSIYQIAIPYTAAQPEEGATLTITGSRRNPGLVGRKFRVTEVLLSTFHLQWAMVCELREGE